MDLRLLLTAMSTLGKGGEKTVSETISALQAEQRDDPPTTPRQNVQDHVRRLQERGLPVRS